MANPAQFARNMIRRAKRYMESANNISRRSASAALSTAVRATPVDTGLARGGWDTKIGSGGNSPRRLDPSGGSAIAAGNSTINGWRAIRGSSLFISNNIEYIGFLEDGSSRQAPRGMTKQAIAAARQVVRSSRLKG